MKTNVNSGKLKVDTHLVFKLHPDWACVDVLRWTRMHCLETLLQ